MSSQTNGRGVRWVEVVVVRQTYAKHKWASIAVSEGMFCKRYTRVAFEFESIQEGLIFIGNVIYPARASSVETRTLGDRSICTS
jgi:hypothetical protein